VDSNAGYSAIRSFSIILGSLEQAFSLPLPLTGHPCLFESQSCHQLGVPTFKNDDSEQTSRDRRCDDSCAFTSLLNCVESRISGFINGEIL
jgi:hypothetical protein